MVKFKLLHGYARCMRETAAMKVYSYVSNLSYT